MDRNKEWARRRKDVLGWRHSEEPRTLALLEQIDWCLGVLKTLNSWSRGL